MASSVVTSWDAGQTSGLLVSYNRWAAVASGHIFSFKTAHTGKKWAESKHSSTFKGITIPQHTAKLSIWSTYKLKKTNKKERGA